jgi:hypothetical protein
VNQRADRLPHRRFPDSIHSYIAGMALGRGGKLIMCGLGNRKTI